MRQQCQSRNIENWGHYEMAIRAQLQRIRAVRNGEIRMEAINHVFSIENSKAQFSYATMLALVASFAGGLMGSLITLIHQNAALFYVESVLILLVIFIIIALAMYMQCQKSLEDMGSYYMVVVYDLIIRRQGVPQP